MLVRVKSALPAETDRLLGKIIGCGINIHRVLGPGFVEGIYDDAMVIELELAGLQFQSQVPVTVTYRGRPLRQQRIDLIVEHTVIVELKAVERLDRVHHAQLMSYLKATGIKVGLLMNFNASYLKAGLKRIVL
jgi:GxxExxY protein